jgi:hypothetical protein
VVDGIFVPNVSVETENHAIQAFPGPVLVLILSLSCTTSGTIFVSRQVRPDETTVKTRT